MTTPSPKELRQAAQCSTAWTGFGRAGHSIQPYQHRLCPVDRLLLPPDGRFCREGPDTPLLNVQDVEASAARDAIGGGCLKALKGPPGPRRCRGAKCLVGVGEAASLGGIRDGVAGLQARADVSMLLLGVCPSFPCRGVNPSFPCRGVSSSLPSRGVSPSFPCRGVSPSSPCSL